MLANAKLHHFPPRMASLVSFVSFRTTRANNNNNFKLKDTIGLHCLAAHEYHFCLKMDFTVVTTSSKSQHSKENHTEYDGKEKHLFTTKKKCNTNKGWALVPGSWEREGGGKIHLYKPHPQLHAGALNHPSGNCTLNLETWQTHTKDGNKNIQWHVTPPPLRWQPCCQHQHVRWHVRGHRPQHYHTPSCAESQY